MVRRGVHAATIAALTLWLTACTGDTAAPPTTVRPTTSTTLSAADVVRHFADGVRRAEPSIDATQATCVAQHVVDALGAEKVADLGDAVSTPLPAQLDFAMVAAYPVCLPPEILAALGNQPATSTPNTTTNQLPGG